MLTVGLTGGIASGKSYAADTFRALGTPVLNADQVARDVVAPGQPALGRIGAEFGAEFLLPDGTLDRAKMRRHVFADADARQRLERITHPAIRAGLLRWRDAQTGPYCVLDVPILVESGMDALVDRILVVDAPEELQVERLVARDRIDAELAWRMIQAQAPRGERLARAHDVVLNAGTLADLAAAVAALHARYLELARTGEKHASGVHLP